MRCRGYKDQRQLLTTKTLDPFFDWIPDYQRRGQASRMTEGGMPPHPGPLPEGEGKR